MSGDRGREPTEEGVRVRVTHHVDSAEPNADGTVDWYYEYDILEFTLGNATLVARSYSDEPGQAHFLRLDGEEERRRSLREADLATPLATWAIAHLRGRGLTELTWLSPYDPAYQPLPLRLITSTPVRRRTPPA